MIVPVMQVGIMCMTVDHGSVPMAMAVRFARRKAWRMVMLVMTVVDVAMVMLERFMRMLMAVRFGQVQPESDRHQNSGNDERRGDRFAEHCHGEERADERRGREIGA